MKARLSEWGVGIALRRMFGVRLGCLYQYSPRPLSVATIKIVSDDRDLPSMSLVTPSFNQARFVGKTIQSVLAQAYPGLEYIVQDACSTDGSEEILRSMSGDAVDVRIERDEGQADALNRGFADASGDIMGYLNSDDLLLPGTLRFVGRYFRDNPAVDVIYGNRLIIDENDSEIGRWILPRHDQQLLHYVDYVPQESMFWRRRAWRRIGGRFDVRLHYAMDWDLILRFVDVGAVFHHLSELFGVFRVHHEQKSQATFVARGAIEMEDLRKRHRVAAMGRIDLLARHGRYLLEHRRADAVFEASLLG